VADRAERLVEARVAAAVIHWPTLEQAFGCLDCKFLFRLPDRSAVSLERNHCPLCESTSIIDVAQFFNKGVGFNAIETTAGLPEVE
jgi:hypothetical protein